MPINEKIKSKEYYSFLPNEIKKLYLEMKNKEKLQNKNIKNSLREDANNSQKLLKKI